MTNTQFSISDRYEMKSGQVLLSGIQALVRLPIDQMRSDQCRNLKTGAFISGYRGSPLGGYDLELGRNRKLLEAMNIEFQPGVNEELGATAVWGSQQVNLFEEATVDGVCGIWYGKTPGVDRSTDAFRHGNAAGSSALGGVLVVAGDDHGCKSSSYPGQSEFAFVDMQMPVLNPSCVQEVLDYGRYGIELSRFSGCWVAMITLAENMDSAAVVNVDPDRLSITEPKNVALPKEGLNIRLPDTPLAQEERLWRHKRPAALSFCRENKLNRITMDSKVPKLAVVTTGKAHLDFMQALEEMGIDEARASELGIRVMKVGMPYPLDVESISEFARGMKHLLVVEEKRSLMEVQLKEELYNLEVADGGFPPIIGKHDALNNALFPPYGELTPEMIATALAKLLPEWCSGGKKASAPDKHSHKAIFDAQQGGISTKRIPYFCSGCPHNTSTKVPDGSRALAGIGCHYLVQSMDRNTYTFTQMGGEGVSWIGQSRFTNTKHVFANLGDGTYFHSGILAIRAAVAAKVNITYKILFNGAVAMTGGQDHDGELRPESIIQQVLAEGVKRIVWVVQDTAGLRSQLPYHPDRVELRQRDELDAVQRELRDCPGVTCIVYDQACATELRRQRKRGLASEPNERLLINTEVCEGCGDCSVQSNCLSIEPLETTHGTKRQINQSSCNKDFSCVKGFCPSFVAVEGGQLKKPPLDKSDWITMGEALESPSRTELRNPWSILVTGVGGTGVVTVGALLSTAAFIEGKNVTSLDQTGMAQKGGAVYSHIRIAKGEEPLYAVRISAGSANALIACDPIAAVAYKESLSLLNATHCKVVANEQGMTTAAFTMGKSPPNDSQRILTALKSHSGKFSSLDAFGIAQAAFGTTTTVNIIMLGAAYQQGLVPLSHETIYQAIRINGVAVQDNIRAFNIGRLAVADSKAVRDKLTASSNRSQPKPETLDQIITHRSEFLTRYQNSGYAERYTTLLTYVREREQAVRPGSEVLSRMVAQYAAKLMAYKDEYEVARLYSDEHFRQQLDDTFSGNYSLNIYRVIVKSGVQNLNQAATWFDSVTSIPSLNFTPVMTFAR